MVLRDNWGRRYRIGKFAIKLLTGGPVREPDVLLVMAQYRQRFFVVGPADLVIEIVSEESAGQDRGDKSVEYEAGDVLEYCIADPLCRESSLSNFAADGA